MAVITIEAVGLRCPQPVLKVAAKSVELAKGDVLEVTGDCPTFERDMKAYCDKTKKVLLWIREEEGGVKRCQIQF